MSGICGHKLSDVAAQHLYDTVAAGTDEWYVQPLIFSFVIFLFQDLSLSSLKTLAVTFASLALLLGVLPSLSQFWLFSFVGGMRVHIAVAAVCLSLIVLGLDRTLWSAIPLVASALLCLWVWHLHQSTVQPDARPDSNIRALKLIEFNILGYNQDGAEIADWLTDQNADVVYTLESGPLRPHLDALAKTYPYRVGCGELVKNCDLMMMSKYPLENPQVRNLGPLGAHRFIRAGININGARATFVAMHLTKPYYETMQLEQLNSVKRYLRDVDGPLILAGDFNSSLLSPYILNFLQTTGLRAFAHEPRTWPVEMPSIGLPIDHILVRQPAYIASVKRVRHNMGSNHFGLEALISLPVTP